MTHVAIIDCGAGNLHSVRKAVAKQLPPNATLDIVTDAAELKKATHIILPGVGAFADCMKGFTALPGMRAALEKKVLEQETPFLGICVGMQMLFERGHEHGNHEGLGWLRGEVRLIAPCDPLLRVPHMGWNRLKLDQPKNDIVNEIEQGSFVYFVHSYSAIGCEAADIIATVDYGGEIVALIGRGKIWGMQFHPEKSQATGLKLLTNFLEIK